MNECNNKRKSTIVAYVLWGLIGWFGAHRFYLERTKSAIAMLSLTVFSFLLAKEGVGFIIIIIPAGWMAIDAFMLPEMVRQFNKKIILADSGVY